MATLGKANELLSELRQASYKAAIKDHEELTAFAKDQVMYGSMSQPQSPLALALTL